MAQVVGAVQVEVVESPHLRRPHCGPPGDAVLTEGHYDGFRIINIAAPANPREIVFQECFGNQGDLVVWDDILIHLKPTFYQGNDLWEKSLAIPAKRLEHQLGQTIWNPDYLGDNARQTIVPQFDGRLLGTHLVANFSEYHNPDVNRLIDRARAELDQARRATLWGQIDQRIMRDAPLVPLIWENSSFQWASRVHGWRYDPWTVTPNLTAPWLDPPSP